MRFCLSVLLVIIGTCLALPQGKFTSEEPNFVYLGSSKSKGHGVRTSDYYLNLSPSTYDAATTSCQRNFNGSLISFDTPDEMPDNLDDYTGQPFWTSGMYSANRWNWLIHGERYPFDHSGLPWDESHPKAGNSFLKIVYNYVDRFDSYFTTEDKSRLHKSICEVNSEPIPIPCIKLNDLAIILDSSGSIGQTDFAIAKTFVARLASAFTVYDPSRLTLIIYSSSARIEIPLSNNLSPAQIDAKIVAANYDAGGTETAAGIDLAVRELVSNNQGAPRSLVVLTDGQSNSPAATIDAANRAIQQGIRTFAVGIANAHMPELLAIAGGNEGHVFTASTFYELIQIIVPLSKKLCPS